MTQKGFRARVRSQAFAVLGVCLLPASRGVLIRTTRHALVPKVIKVYIKASSKKRVRQHHSSYKKDFESQVDRFVMHVCTELLLKRYWVIWTGYIITANKEKTVCFTMLFKYSHSPKKNHNFFVNFQRIKARKLVPCYKLYFFNLIWLWTVSVEKRQRALKLFSYMIGKGQQIVRYLGQPKPSRIEIDVLKKPWSILFIISPLQNEKPLLLRL